ncbi:hypothetical protein O3P69_019572 [Scylla paramamosain]|uniref:Uncharacterized protein n=1 Tax=Scylla paramamosain TaxID=85552 RepID=A0AAW0T0A2_SCYPA
MQHTTRHHAVQTMCTAHHAPASSHTHSQPVSFVVDTTPLASWEEYNGMMIKECHSLPYTTPANTQEQAIELHRRYTLTTTSYSNLFSFLEVGGSQGTVDGTADDTNVTASDVTVRAAVGHKFVNANFQRHLFVCLFRFYERNCSWYKEAAQAQHCLKTVPKQGFPSPSKCSVMVMLADHLEGFLHYKCNGAVQSLIAWNASLTNASKYTDQLILNM